MYPVLVAVQTLGGSASGREITDRVLDAEGYTEEQTALTYGTRNKSVLVDRLEWARSYCKLAGALDSPARKLYLLAPLGHEVLALPEREARARLAELDRAVRASRKRRPSGASASSEVSPADEPLRAEDLADDTEEDTAWTEALLGRLHRLSPDAFEEFCLYLLRLFGLELTRRGGSGDEGIDGIGTAPLSDVLSATVAVQVKRYDPSSTVGREVVALFQRDASAVGAERAILITLGRFTAPARKAANSATPHVDLIDGERLCELVLAKEVGVSRSPVVNLAWFDRFG
jgi:restriction system protein